MAEEKKSAPRKPAAKKAAGTTKAAAAKAAPAEKKSAASMSRGSGIVSSTPSLTLATLRENLGARPKRQRIGRGHGSGMVKTGGEGGKGQTVRSGGGKGPAFEGGQTPWARRLPQRKGVSQKSRDIGHFRSKFAVIGLSELTDWEPAVPVNPETLKAYKGLKKQFDGIKILGGLGDDEKLPTGLQFSDVVFSASAREALIAAGAKLPEE
jgi:large subunit ribosomal protein L15